MTWFDDGGNRPPHEPASHPTVMDYNGRTITIGARLPEVEGCPAGTVVAITDLDGDVDDDGRPIGINPKVGVKWDDDPDNIEYLDTHWTAVGWWDEDAPYQCDDLEVQAQ